MRIAVAADTHVGLKRDHNEDSFLVQQEDRLFVVADGMGGHSSGEVASRMAVEELGQFFAATRGDPDFTWPYRLDRKRSFEENRLAAGIRLANRKIFDRSRSDPSCRGMGTTLASIHFADGSAYIAHVGDSRVYRFRDGALSLLTQDHSLLNDFLKAGRLTPAEAEAFPHKNVIVRALGMNDDVEVDLRAERAEPGDRFLICSDGLSSMIDDAAIAGLLRDYPDTEGAVTAMIQAANGAGGLDNVTVLLAHVG